MKVKDFSDFNKRDEDELKEQEKSLRQEQAFLKSRWKALKAFPADEMEDEEDKKFKASEKSYIAGRWKQLKTQAKNLKSITDGLKAYREKNNPVAKFLKAFARHHQKDIKGAAEFLMKNVSPEDDPSNDPFSGQPMGKDFDWDHGAQLKAYHYGMCLEKAIAMFGDGDYQKGLTLVNKAFVTEAANAVDVTKPSGPSKYNPGNKDDAKLQQFGGESLTKKGKGFSELEEAAWSHADVNHPSNDSKIAKLGADKDVNPWEDGPHLVNGVKQFPELDEATGKVNTTKPSGPLSYTPGKEPMQQFGGGSLVKYLKAIAEASTFLKSIAHEKALSISRKELGHRLAIALKGIAETDLNKPGIVATSSKELEPIVGSARWLQEEGDEPEHKGKKEKSMKTKAVPGLEGDMGGEMGGGLGGELGGELGATPPGADAGAMKGLDDLGGPGAMDTLGGGDLDFDEEYGGLGGLGEGGLDEGDLGGGLDEGLGEGGLGGGLDSGGLDEGGLDEGGLGEGGLDDELGGLDDEEEDLDKPTGPAKKNLARYGKSLDAITNDALRTSQNINRMQQALANLATRL